MCRVQQTQQMSDVALKKAHENSKQFSLVGM